MTLQELADVIGTTVEFKSFADQKGRTICSLSDVWTSDGYVLTGEYGDAFNSQDAARQYCQKIAGKDCVFGPYTDKRKEFIAPVELVWAESEPAEDWPAKYRDLKIRAVAKNAGLIRAILRIKNMIHLGGFVGFYAEAIKRVIEESQNEFTFNQAEPPEPETGILSFAEAQPDFSAERAELVTALNKIVYHYRNGSGKKLAKAIWNADKLIQEYV
jgi:hypothetical protein